MIYISNKFRKAIGRLKQVSLKHR